MIWSCRICGTDLEEEEGVLFCPGCDTTVAYAALDSDEGDT